MCTRFSVSVGVQRESRSKRSETRRRFSGSDTQIWGSHWRPEAQTCHQDSGVWVETSASLSHSLNYPPLFAFAVEQSHQTMLNNLRNSHETSMRQLILKHDEDQETMRREKVKELEQIRASFEDKLRIKEQEHLRIVQELQQRDQEWQLEKQVTKQRQ